MEPTDATTGPAASLSLLRQQLAGLLADIDTATLPPPDAVHGPRHARPGAEWRPDGQWCIFTVDTPDGQGAVYVDHACDDIRYRFMQPGDWEAMRPGEARRIGLAFLAAADRAEQVFTGVSVLDVRRGGRP